MKHKHNEAKSRTLKVKGLGVATLLAFTLSLSTVTAQESVNATGGNASGGGGSVSYSVGQVMYQNHTGTNGSVVQGVQQPYEISVVTAIEEAIGITLSVTVYPNPTADYLTLIIDAATTLSLQSMSYQLFDMNGKILQNEEITDHQTSIVMSNLVAGTYFVKVIVKTRGNASQQEVKTFKVFKK